MKIRIYAPALPRSFWPTRVRRAAFFLAAAALVNLDAAEPPAAPVAIKPPARRAPEVIHTVAPEHPPEMRQQLLNGEAEIECLIGADGRIIEATVDSATHPEFGEAALVAIRQWEFKAGERDGQPAAMRVKIPVTFQLSSQMVIETLARRPVYVDVSETVIPAEQLPAWPMPKKYILPRYPKVLKGSGKRGKAVVAVVIDKEGKVINPKIVKSSYPEFDLPAQMAAVNLEFPPQRLANKEAIFVSMEIQYDFSAEGAKPRAGSPEKARPPPAPAKKPSKD